MRSSMILSLLLFSVPLTAQVATPPVYNTYHSSCPVHFSAERNVAADIGGMYLASNDPLKQQVAAANRHYQDLLKQRTDAEAALQSARISGNSAAIQQAQTKLQMIEKDVTGSLFDLKALQAKLDTAEQNQVSGPHGQGLRFSFAGSSSPIVEAELSVHGMSPHDYGLVLTAKPLDGTEETFHLSGTSSRPLLHPVIRTKEMNAITWVELTKLVYANGTTWQARSPGECIMQPSLYVPVNAKLAK